MGLLRDYSHQVATYDRTRSASSSVLAILRQALAGAPGPRLLDIGGTGNYAQALTNEGWNIGYLRGKGPLGCRDCERRRLDEADLAAVDTNARIFVLIPSPLQGAIDLEYSWKHSSNTLAPVKSTSRGQPTGKDGHRLRAVRR